jgi:4'-phosphopantetheinyl transferase
MTWTGLQPGMSAPGVLPPPGECHVWVGRTGAADQAFWAGLLDAGDAAYVAGHRQAADRERTTVSRGLLRLLVSHYLAVPAAAVPLRRGCSVCGSERHGRPSVPGTSGLTVSVAHSGGRVLVAAMGTGSVGADLEATSEVLHPDDLAAVILTPGERVSFRAVPPPSRPAWLLRAWVRKEAVVKAVGTGFMVEPGALDVSDAGPVVLPGGGAAPGQRSVAQRVIHVQDIGTEPGYLAALASTVPITNIRTWVVSR